MGTVELLFESVLSLCRCVDADEVWAALLSRRWVKGGTDTLQLEADMAHAEHQIAKCAVWCKISHCSPSQDRHGLR